VSSLALPKRRISGKRALPTSALAVATFVTSPTAADETLAECRARSIVSIFHKQQKQFYNEKNNVRW
jgi:hypothetical protein